MISNCVVVKQEFPPSLLEAKEYQQILASSVFQKFAKLHPSYKPNNPDELFLSVTVYWIQHYLSEGEPGEELLCNFPGMLNNNISRIFLPRFLKIVFVEKTSTVLQTSLEVQVNLIKRTLWLFMEVIGRRSENVAFISDSFSLLLARENRDLQELLLSDKKEIPLAIQKDLYGFCFRTGVP